MTARVPYMSRADREVRRNRILFLLRAGNPPSIVARLEGLTIDHVRQIGLNNGLRRDSEPQERVSSVWEMDEDARRDAFKLRAAHGAAATREAMAE